MSETRTDVASTLVSTLFSLEPLSFDVAKAYETLDHIAACSECEDFIDALQDIIDTLRKTDGALEDVHKLRLINEVQFVALKVSLPHCTLSFESEEEKQEQARHGFCYSRHSRKKQRANELNRSGNTTPTPTAHEDSEAMEGDSSSSDESSPETKNTKDTTPIVAENGARDSANGKGNLTYTEDEDFTLVSRKKKIASIFIDASQNTTELLNTLSNHRGNTLEGRFENGKLRVFPKTILEHRKLQSFLAAKKMRSHTFEMADNKQLKAARYQRTSTKRKPDKLKGGSIHHISFSGNRKTNKTCAILGVLNAREK
ncbi:hypothetical protein TNIN_295431 [Trichonephila inaurata madagascariensis]|uniref:Uncharacterized protein n=1 Tax=Trichonephila inaurata madagascariensis TaxID=2747483 RepID=A0A8X7CQP3_9ARAC|nr:hypothetical protein TNIN_295431 [Trichonephila inaurata madagascariensis]